MIQISIERNTLSYNNFSKMFYVSFSLFFKSIVNRNQQCHFLNYIHKRNSSANANLTFFHVHSKSRLKISSLEITKCEQNKINNVNRPIVNSWDSTYYAEKYSLNIGGWNGGSGGTEKEKSGGRGRCGKQ